MAAGCTRHLPRKAAVVARSRAPPASGRVDLVRPAALRLHHFISACYLHLQPTTTTTRPRHTALLHFSYIMISALRTPRSRLISSRLTVRSLSTEQVAASTPHLPPHLPPPQGHSTRPPTRSRINPAPRPAVPRTRQALPSLPSSFGRNQILPVADSTRALLEKIVAQFHAPIRYAFAYGSGVFEQAGYSASTPTSKDGPMLDFLFAVTHASHFHSINMNQYPGHYPMYARMLGSDFVARVEDIRPGVWFNAFVPMEGVVSPLHSKVHASFVHAFITMTPDNQVRRHDSGQPVFRPA